MYQLIPLEASTVVTGVLTGEVETVRWVLNVVG